MVLCLTETTLYYHHLRGAYPATQSNSGIIANWADQVADAASCTPTPSSHNLTRAGLDHVSSGSRRTTREKENKILAGLAQTKHLPQKRKLDDNEVTLYPTPPARKKACKELAPLPPGTEDNNMFHSVFIPTYERWIGTLADPWVIPDDVAIKTLQTIWDSIYPSVPWTVKINDCVFERVAQRLYEWRSSFKSAADIMMEQFFEFCSDNYEEFVDYNSRQAWAENMLKGLKFVWAVADEDKRSGLMRAPFILQVFATHLNSIVGAEEVPGLEFSRTHDNTSDDVKYLPKGALGMAAAAVERTLRLWAEGEMGHLDDELAKKQANRPAIKVVSKSNPQTGVVSNAASNFSIENWGKVARYYIMSIDKMKVGSLEKIVKLAMPYVSPLDRCRTVSTREPQALATDDEDLGPRACLVDEITDSGFSHVSAH